MVLLAGQTTGGSVAEMWRIIDTWNSPDPIFGLELLDGQ